MVFIQKEDVLGFLVEKYFQIRTKILCYQLLWLGMRKIGLILESS